MATRQVTMPLLMTELSYLLGEVSVPTSGVSGRKIFLQRALEDVWKLYPWPFSLTDTTLQFTLGVATLPDDFLPEGHYYLIQNGKELFEAEYGRKDLQTGSSFYTYFDQGDYKAKLINSGIVDTTTSTLLDFRYQYTLEELNSNDLLSAYYPNPKTIALGALAQVVKADNPEADNAQESSAFLVAAQEDYSAFNRIRMRNKRAHSVAEKNGHSTGEF